MAKLRMMTSELRPGCTEIIGAVSAPRERREQYAEGEGEPVDAVHADAHAGAHFVIMDDGQHDLAGDGAIEAEPDRKADRGRDRDQRKVVADIERPAELDVAEQLVGLRRIDKD